MQSSISFGQWIKNRRKALDLTQEALAQRVGCAPETLRKIEAGRRRPSQQLVELLAGGLANAVNFVRPARLVLVSEFLRFPAFADALQREIRRRLLVALADRVRIDLWDQPAGRGGETAGWLALASLCLEGWQQATQERKT